MAQCSLWRKPDGPIGSCCAQPVLWLHHQTGALVAPAAADFTRLRLHELISCYA